MAVTMAKQEIDKKLLYGKFQDAEDRRARFAERIAHKAADMAMEDPMQITNTRAGIGTAGIMGIAAAAGLPGLTAAAILGYALLKGDGAPQAPSQPPAAAASPADSEYEVRFYDKDGKLIEVPRRKP